ncbi:hypothetical protein ASD28_22055 [Massilia sp. Root133]|nr:hypothetical protein ASD28_22055 [Massilia sp. Root133]
MPPTVVVGAVRSTVNVRPPEAPLALPAASVTIVDTVCWPAPSVELVMLQVPPVATVLPSSVLPSYRSTVAPASAVPVKVGVVAAVMPSLFDTPVSLAASSTGIDDAAGASVSK